MSKHRPGVNTAVRSFYSQGFSSIMVTFYNANLAFHFYKYIGKDYNGLDKYDKNSITTSVNYDGAAVLYIMAMSILDGTNSEKEMRAVVSCNKASLIFEYKREQDNQMVAYLTIDKNNQTMTFKFSTRTLQAKKDGQVITEVIQSKLCAFAKTIDGYLSGVGADIHLSKLPDELHDEIQYGAYSNENGNGYQNGSW